jgi:hypothetical protein
MSTYNPFHYKRYVPPVPKKLPEVVKVDVPVVQPVKHVEPVKPLEPYEPYKPYVS